jgi:hypothetical protein
MAIRIITDEEKKLIFDLRAQGLSYRAISIKLDNKIAQQRVFAIIHDNIRYEKKKPNKIKKHLTK